MTPKHLIPPKIKSFMRRQIVEAATGKSRSTIYRDIKLGIFPKPVPIGVNKNGGACAVAWITDEIAAYNQARIAGKSEQEIKELVAELEVARTTQNQGGAE